MRWFGGLALLSLCLGCKSSPVDSGAGALAAAPAPAPPGPAPVPARVPPSPTPSAGAAAAPDPCARICERTRPLGCKRTAQCASNCREMRGAAACAGEMDAVLGCFAREPVAHWECNEEGEAAIKVGYCDAEQGKFVACLQRAAGDAPAPRPGPGPS